MKDTRWQKSQNNKRPHPKPQSKKAESGSRNTFTRKKITSARLSAEINEELKLRGITTLDAVITECARGFRNCDIEVVQYTQQKLGEPRSIWYKSNTDFRPDVFCPRYITFKWKVNDVGLDITISDDSVIRVSNRLFSDKRSFIYLVYSEKYKIPADWGNFWSEKVNCEDPLAVMKPIIKKIVTRDFEDLN